MVTAKLKNYCKKSHLQFTLKVHWNNFKSPRTAPVNCTFEPLQAIKIQPFNTSSRFEHQPIA